MPSFFSAIPLPPGAPNVVDWSERHMDIEWSVPLDDGGAPITAYHIEAKSKNEDDDWQLWETIDTNRTKASVQKLLKGREYQFRVIAMNKAGKSDPSHPSRTKEALPRSRKHTQCDILRYFPNIRFYMKSIYYGD